MFPPEVMQLLFIANHDGFGVRYVKLCPIVQKLLIAETLILQGTGGAGGNTATAFSTAQLVNFYSVFGENNGLFRTGFCTSCTAGFMRSKVLTD